MSLPVADGTFLGINPKKVIQLLLARRVEGKNEIGAGTTIGRSYGGRNAGPSARRRKLALIVEGGGMRGVLSAGSLLALDLLGFRNCFDHVYATSSGAVNAAYFLAGQGGVGITVYFDDICCRRFYNPYRITKMVDVDYVYDYVVPHRKPLDEKAVRESHTDLYFSMTDVQSGRNVLIDVKRSSEPVHRLLKATSALPILYNRTVAIEDRRYVDGGVTCTIPIQQAAAHGCTDILILLTKLRGYTVPRPTIGRKLVLYLLMGYRYPALMDAYAQLHGSENRNRQSALGLEPPSGVNIATLCPTDAELIVQRTTLNRDRLIDGARLMAERTFRALGEDPTSLRELFEHYRRGDSIWNTQM